MSRIIVYDRALFGSRHMRCKNTPADSLTLKLTSVSDQMHRETRPLPFYLNGLTFTAGDNIEVLFYGGTLVKK